MGRERAVLIWQVHAQVLLDELQRVEAQLAAHEQQAAGSRVPEDERLAALRERARVLRARLNRLGPSPQAKMG